MRVRWRADDDDGGGSTSLSDGPKAKRNNIVSPLPIAFEDNSSNIATQFMYSQPLPQHPRYYCFFLTNIVAGTLRRGGFMTESVYVPRVIWFAHTRRFSHAFVWLAHDFTLTPSRDPGDKRAPRYLRSFSRSRCASS